MIMNAGLLRSTLDAEQRDFLMIRTLGFSANVHVFKDSANYTDFLILLAKA
jgi:hypothetical protein